MRVVAVLAVRVDRLYLANCLSHLVENGIDFAVVDHDSADGCVELLHDRRFAGHLAGYLHIPFTGVFAWREILLAQERLLSSIDADWHLLVAPDEIMHSYVSDETLACAIARLDRQGYDVINFDEFVFLPVERDYVPDHDGVQPLRHYYFYEPRNPNQMRVWKKSAKLSNIEGAGHLIFGSEVRLAPETFALRHYIFRNQAHAFEKYAGRAFATDEVSGGWHFDRVGQIARHFAFPPASELECLAAPHDRNLNRSNPRKTHYWEGVAPPSAPSGAANEAASQSRNPEAH